MMPLANDGKPMFRVRSREEGRTRHAKLEVKGQMKGDGEDPMAPLAPMS